MKNKIFAVLAIVIVVGIIMAFTVKFNIDKSYRAYHMLDLRIGKEFNVSDVEGIAKEIFGNKVLEVNNAGVYADRVEIKVIDVTDEQVESLNTKINEKYGIDNKIEDIDRTFVPNYGLKQIVKPYIIPLAISTGIILVYECIRFRKLGISKIIYQIISLSIMAELLYGSIIVITRYPVNRLVMPVGVVIYIAVLTALTSSFEKQIKTEKTDKKEAE